MTSPDDRAADQEILNWFTRPASSEDDHKREDEAIRQYLLRGRRQRQPLTALTRLLLPPTRRATGHEVAQARRNELGWVSIGFGVDRVGPWLRAGAFPHEYNLVADLVAEGIFAPRVSEQFEHPRTGERVTVLDVAREFFRTLGVNDFRSLSEALDDAGVERTKGQRPTARFGLDTEELA